MGFAIKVAWRFLVSNRMQTIFIVLGIAVGVSVQIFIGLLIQGLQSSLINKTVGNSSQITLKPVDVNERISNWEIIPERLEKIDNSIINISPVVDVPAFIEDYENTDSVLIRGVDYKKASGIYNIYNNIIFGKIGNKNIEDSENDKRIIIGKELADKIKIDVGDKFNINTTAGKKITLMVEAVFDFKVQQINEKWVLTDLATAQEIADISNEITSIEMQLDKVFSAADVSKKIEDKIGLKDIVVKNWIDENEQLLSGLKGQDISSWIIQLFVLIAVLLGISSVLAITVMQKSKQIGILKAMGVKDRIASIIFLFEGFVLGLAGAVMGLLLGLGLLYSFETFARNSDGSPVVPIYINGNFIVFSCAVAIVVSILASLIPAWKSSKLSPIEVIRNG